MLVPATAEYSVRYALRRYAENRSFRAHMHAVLLTGTCAASGLR